MIRRHGLKNGAVVLIGLALSGLAATGADPGWRPAPSPLMTRWGKLVTPDNAWTLYPRPQLVRRDWQNLNGPWDYAVTSGSAAWPGAFDGKILVPFCIESPLSGVGRQRPLDHGVRPHPSRRRGQRLEYCVSDFHLHPDALRLLRPGTNLIAIEVDRGDSDVRLLDFGIYRMAR
jgi:hypothetical protein